MLLIITAQIIFLILVSVGFYYLLKKVFFILEYQFTLFREFFNERSNHRKLKKTIIRTHKNTHLVHFCGLTFGQQTTYEQKYYLNIPTGHPRMISKKTLIAPELNLPVITSKFAEIYINAKLSNIPIFANKLLKNFW